MDSELAKDMCQVQIDLEKQVKGYVEFGGIWPYIGVPPMVSLTSRFSEITFHSIRVSSRGCCASKVRMCAREVGWCVTSGYQRLIFDVERNGLRARVVYP